MGPSACAPRTSSSRCPANKPFFPGPELAGDQDGHVRRHGTDPLEPFGAGASHFEPVCGPGEHLAH